MYILKHYYSVVLFRNEEGENIYHSDLDTVEKIENFKPRFFKETKKLKIEKETKKSYMVVGIDGDEREEKTYISKIPTEEEVTLNSPIYPDMQDDRMNCLLYTLNVPEEVAKGQEVILEYFKSELNIKMAKQRKMIETLESIF